MNSIEAWQQDPELLKNAIKELRVSIDGDTRYAKQLAEAIARGNGGRNVALAITHLEDAKMRLGMALGDLGHKLPEEFRDEAK